MQGDTGYEYKEITIYDIAREAGVSPATVSRAMSGSANVRKEKKDRILELVEKYHFQPNALAKGLSDARSKIIGILVSDIRNPYYAEVFVSCEQAARRVGYTTILSNSMNDKSRELRMIDRLKRQRVDAIIIIGGQVDEITSKMEYVAHINQVMATTPIIVTGRLDGTRCPSVRIDSMKAMELLMSHLLGLGHEKIALVGGKVSVLASYEKVIQYKQMMAEARLPYEPEWISEDGDYNVDNGYEQMNRLFEIRKVPTAVIAINDFAAAGVLRSIQEHGLHVPEDISVVSYDNTYISEILNPSLTTIDYNYAEFGRILVQTCIQTLEENGGSLLQTVTPRLVIRKSTGPAPEKAGQEKDTKGLETDI